MKLALIVFFVIFFGLLGYFTLMSVDQRTVVAGWVKKAAWPLVAALAVVSFLLYLSLNFNFQVI